MISVTPKSERLNRLLDHWQTLKGDLDIPARGCFSPLDVPKEDLPYLILLDVKENATSFSYRLVGSGVVGFVGHEFTGKSISEYQHMHEGADMIDGYLVAARERRPTHYDGSLTRFDKEYVLYERVALPLRADKDDRRVIQILAGFEFRYANSTLVGSKASIWPNEI